MTLIWSVMFVKLAEHNKSMILFLPFKLTVFPDEQMQHAYTLCHHGNTLQCQSCYWKKTVFINRNKP